MKTASQLFTEYYDKPPQDRINSTVQDYVFNYQQSIIDEQNKRIEELNRKLQVYEKHVHAINFIHLNQFDQNTDSSFILGNLDGFFECLEDDLKCEAKQT